jgi:hypothetical protein
VETESIPDPPHEKAEPRIGFLGVLASPAVESAFRDRYLRDDLWLGGLLVIAGMLRVGLFLVADYRHFDLGPVFWVLIASRLVFLLVSAWVFVALRRAGSPAVADRLLFLWGFLIVAMTVGSLSARPPSNTALLFMSFGVVLVAYCVMPLPLSRQAALALVYSGAILFVSRQTDGETLVTVAAVHGMAHVFGTVTSWRLNRRRRERFVGALREAELRTHLEAALAEVRTLRGFLCICAWCKRVRDEAQVWESLERFVQTRTDASFSHGICPDCLQSQEKEVARLRATPVSAPRR